MKCSFCGYEFSERHAATSCAGCPMKPGCELIRCPNCGFEIPKEPEWIKKIANLIRRKKEHGVKQ